MRAVSKNSLAKSRAVKQKESKSFIRDGIVKKEQIALRSHYASRHHPRAFNSCVHKNLRSKSVYTLANPSKSPFSRPITKRKFWLGELFKEPFVHKCERLLFLFGIINAIGSGCFLPLMSEQFGELTNKMVVLDIALTGRGKEFVDAPYCIRAYENYTEIKRNVGKNYQHLVVTAMNQYVFYHAVYATGLTLSSFIYFFIFQYLGEKQMDRISIEYFTSFLRKDMKWLESQDEPDLTGNIIDNTQRLREGIGENLAIGISLISVCVQALIFAFIHGYLLTLVTCACIPFVIGVTYYVALSEAKEFIQEQASYSKAGSLAEDVLLNIRSVMIYGGEKKEFNEYCTIIEEGRSKVNKKVWIFSILNGIMWALSYCSYASSFFYGSYLVLGNRDQDTKCEDDKKYYSPGDLLVIFGVIMYGALNIGLLIPIVQGMLVANQCTEDVSKILLRDSEIDLLSTSGKVLTKKVAGEFEFKNVSFAYPSRPDERILHNIDMKLESGKQYAFVGPSGAGKSTILKLLSKIYLPTSGVVTFDGTDLKELNSGWIKSQMGTVSQDPGLFDLTIEENVRMGKPDASFEEIVEVCKTAHAHDFIMKLKNKYATKCGFQGSRLSGGQRQLIAIARVLLRNPKILFLDEFTSALDMHSETLVLNAMKRLRKDKCFFIVTHRLYTITNSDKIFVIKGGKIEESGTHNELLNNRGLYFLLATGEYDKASGDRAVLPKLQNPQEQFHNLDVYRALEATIKLPFKTTTHFQSGTATETIVHEHEVHRPDHHHQHLDNKPHHITFDDHVATEGEDIHGTDDFFHQIIVDEHLVEDPMAEYLHHRHFGEKEVAKQVKVLQQEQTRWKKYLSHEDLTNTMIDVDPGKTFSFLKILHLASINPGLIALGFVASFIMGIAQPAFSFVFTRIIEFMSAEAADPSDDLIKVEDATRECYKILVFFVVIGILAGISTTIQSYTLLTAGHRAVSRIRKRLYLCFLRQDAQWHEEPGNSVTVLSSRLSGDAPNMEFLTMSIYGVIIQCISMVGVAVALSFLVAMKFAVKCLLLVPVLVGIGLMDSFISKIQESRTASALDDISKIVLDVFQNRLIVMHYQLENYFIAKYKKGLDDSKKSSALLIFLRSVGYGLSQSATFWIYTIAMYLAVELISNKEETYSNALKVGDSFLIIGTAISLIPSFTKARASGNKILRILKRRPMINLDDAKGSKLDTCDGDIEFRNVEFSFHEHPGHKALNGISFSVDRGQMIGIVGRTGAGKSTCVNLCLRFYDTDKGEILIDGQNIEDLYLPSLRDHLAYIGRTPKVFNTRTIAENIAYGNNSKAAVFMKEIIRAATEANLHNFVTTLREGYDTVVGSAYMSGGQKQRIAIARAFLEQKRKILILDDAVSTLDRESERLVMESVEKSRHGRTCLIIAHHLNTVQHADKIIILGDGVILDQGTHSDLYNGNAWYAGLWKTQNLLSNERFMSLPEVLKASIRMDLMDAKVGSTSLHDLIAGLIKKQEKSRNRETEEPEEPNDAEIPNESQPVAARKKYTQGGTSMMSNLFSKKSDKK